MGLRQTLARAAASLIGLSAYEVQPSAFSGATISEADEERYRKLYGGQLQRQETSTTRWYMSDLEVCETAADQGLLKPAAKLMRAALRDGVISGVLSTRTSGLVRLPKTFRGDAEAISALELGHDSTRAVFDEIFPPSELAAFAADGELLGVGIGKLVPVSGRDYPVFVRLDPVFLVYRWQENRWYFEGIAGLVPITPGDGVWILHTPGGRNAPWQHGLWRSIGRAYIRKEHAALHKDNWEAKLANPARVAVASTGASEEERQGFFSQLLAWGINTVFSLPPGWDVKIVESNGRGHDSFSTTIQEQNTEITICIAGQTVTTDGGTGFANADIHKSIRADLIKATADSLAYTINTQGLPAFIVARWGEDALATKSVVVAWDVTPPKDRSAEAQSLLTVATAITALTDALSRHQRELDVGALAARFGIPILNDANGDGEPDVVRESSDDSTVTPIRRAA
jgi:hypothetical protein